MVLKRTSRNSQLIGTIVDLIIIALNTTSKLSLIIEWGNSILLHYRTRPVSVSYTTFFKQEGIPFGIGKSRGMIICHGVALVTYTKKKDLDIVSTRKQRPFVCRPLFFFSSLTFLMLKIARDYINSCRRFFTLYCNCIPENLPTGYCQQQL